MRILQINTTCNTGSTGVLAYHIHQMLIANGHESVVCYGRGKKISDAYKFNCMFGVAIDILLSRITGFNGIFSSFATIRLIKYIKKFKPDVVHIHNLHGYYVNFYKVTNYLKNNNIFTVWTMHDEYLFTGRCGMANDCDKWKTGCKHCKDLNVYPRSLLLDCANIMYKMKKKIFQDWNNIVFVTPSLWLQQKTKQCFLFGHPIIVVHNGIDCVNTFYSHDSTILKSKLGLIDKKIILAIAPNIMNEHKGGRFILQMAKKMKCANVHFILIGTSAKEAMKVYDNNVTVITRIENQIELAQYYSMADLFVTCSKSETFSLTCAESICCGTPVVGFEAGAPETVFPKPYASFVKYSDINALCAEVMLMINSKANLNCELYGKEHYSKLHMITNYLRIYEGEIK